MSNIFGPAGPFMHPDQIFCYSTPIVLKFGTQKGSPTANPSIKFGANPMNGSGVMTNYSRKTRSICCHAYRVNRFME